MAGSSHEKLPMTLQAVVPSLHPWCLQRHLLGHRPHDSQIPLCSWALRRLGEDGKVGEDGNINATAGFRTKHHKLKCKPYNSWVESYITTGTAVANERQGCSKPLKVNDDHKWGKLANHYLFSYPISSALYLGLRFQGLIGGCTSYLFWK